MKHDIVFELDAEQERALRDAGYEPELRWRKTIGVGTSVVCTTGEALANVALDARRRRVNPG